MAASTKERETSEYVAFTQRTIRGLGARVAGGEIDHLKDLAELRELIDVQLDGAVFALRAEPHYYSAAAIGRQLGITRQAVTLRWPHTAGRRAGGQPGDLR